LNYLDILIPIRKIVRSISIDSKRIEKDYGVSIPQLLTLQFLSTQPEYKATSTEIKNYLNLNASTVSGIISRLLSKSLLAKVPNPSDKRASYIILTVKGFDLLQQSPVTLQEKMENRLDQLSDAEKESLRQGIALLVKLMDAESIDASPIITTSEIDKS